MFGFGDKRPEALDETERYLRSMFAELGDTEDGVVPLRVFEDPYVVGFLTVLSIHSAAVVYKSRTPDEAEIVGIMVEALDRLYPGVGALARATYILSANRGSAANENYRRGRSDGSELVRRLLTTYDNMGTRQHQVFQDYIRQHYLS